MVVVMTQLMVSMIRILITIEQGAIPIDEARHKVERPITAKKHYVWKRIIPDRLPPQAHLKNIKIPLIIFHDPVKEIKVRYLLREPVPDQEDYAVEDHLVATGRVLLGHRIIEIALLI